MTTKLLRLIVCISLAVIALPSFSLSNDELFDLSFEELLDIDISVASNVVSDIRKQPVSVTSISKENIKLSGARTLNELLTIFVPGYFLVEDQDDTIAGFRGLVPDNNSKTMLLLNGVNLNTEWFWGAPDAILNGLDMAFIERIEVIRGPGSVTLGQGALLGVINIITKKADQAFVNASMDKGKDGLDRYNIDMSFKSEQTSAYAYFSNGDYQGQSLRDEGWANARSDQGLTVFERNHKLKRSAFTNFFANVTHQNIELDIFHFEQKRDLYNFFRDREIVGQTIDGIAGHYNYAVNDDVKLTFSTQYTQDDYALFTHGSNLPTNSRLEYEQNGSGFSSITSSLEGLANNSVQQGLVMGGTREVRKGMKFLVNWNNLWQNNQIAFGFEVNEYDFGQNNSNGHNFIINEEIQRLGLTSDGSGGVSIGGSVNENNTWVKPADITIKSLFVEDFYKLNDNIDLFAALRFDDHPNWGSHTSPRLGGFFNLADNQIIRLTWQTGFRGAVGVQYAGGFVQDGFLAQNNFSHVNTVSTTNADFDWDGDPSNDSNYLSSVEPETIESLEIAYSYNDEKLKVNGVVFFNSVEDILAAEAHGYSGLSFGDKIGTDDIGTWGGNWYYQNQEGKLNQWGFELEGEYRLDNLVLSASHAHVAITSADEDTIGIYAINDEKTAAYPPSVTRFHAKYLTQSALGNWSLHYNHLYYWHYHSPTGVSIDSNHLVNLGINWSPQDSSQNYDISIIIKNLWDQDELYPINGTGDTTAGDGTPSVESRTWWLNFNYSF